MDWQHAHAHGREENRLTDTLGSRKNRGKNGVNIGRSGQADSWWEPGGGVKLSYLGKKGKMSSLKMLLLWRFSTKKI
jgi:hypothetical protein